MAVEDEKTGIVCVFVCACTCLRARAHLVCVFGGQDRGAEMEWSCLMTGTADLFREQ